MLLCMLLALHAFPCLQTPRVPILSQGLRLAHNDLPAAQIGVIQLHNLSKMHEKPVLKASPNEKSLSKRKNSLLRYLRKEKDF